MTMKKIRLPAKLYYMLTVHGCSNSNSV